jgi:transcriptional regulator with XRE-family HTH domain
VLKVLLGLRIKYYRKKRKFTQDRLAEAVGVSDGRTIRAWERGKAFPEADNIESLCKVLNVTIRELFDFDYP